MTILQASCPSCGGSLQFKAGTTVVIVCPYCRSAVARTDQAFEDIGKVAELVETRSPLTLGLAGRYHGQAFELVGRAQLGHSAGGVWDEWYAHFADGTWGWLAEAQGRFYLTFQKQAGEAAGHHVPSFDDLALGEPVPGISSQILFVVAEKDEARAVAAEGEIPWRFEPGSLYFYADLSAAGGKFGTLDYSEAPPLVFLGHETTLTELGITAPARPEAERSVAAATLGCPNCGGPLALRAPDICERIVCPNCDSLLDVSQGELRFFRTLKQDKLEPKIPLGATGQLEGGPFTVIGFMQRSVSFDKTYYWEEYLLYNPQVGFRWLVNSDDHWSFVQAIPPGEVEEHKKSLTFRGKNFRLFQDTAAKVEHVAGEFYWRVTLGEKVHAADFVHQPEMISKEVSKGNSGGRASGEVNYSLGLYLTPKQVERAFGISGLPQPHTVAPNQPSPAQGVLKLWLLLMTAALVLGVILLVAVPQHTILTQTYTLAPLPNADGTQTIFSDKVELRGNRNIEIIGTAPVDNSWVYVEGDLINEETGLVQSFSLPIEYYSGVDGGESWSEGSKKQTVYLSALPAGTYTMRLEAQWQNWTQPTSVTVFVTQGVPRIFNLLLTLLALSIIPIIVLFVKFSFERRRWADSQFNPYKSS